MSTKRTSKSTGKPGRKPGPKHKSEPKRKTGFPWRTLSAMFLVVFVLFSIGLFLYIKHEIEHRFASHKWSVPSTMYSATVPIYPGQALSMDQVERMLAIRRYQESATQTLKPGEFSVNGNTLQVNLRKFHSSSQSFPARLVQFHFEQDTITGITGSQGNVPLLELNPIELTRMYGPKRQSRILININNVSPYLINAVISIEDHLFYQHAGISLRGIARALWADLRAGRVVEGGSTITQQLVKNYFLTPQRTFKRKAIEACMALVMGTMYSKNEILEMYMNEVYMGQHGGVAIHGMGEAARSYFGRNVSDLSLDQAATLAGMIVGPNYYSPVHNPSACKDRRNVVLQHMHEYGKITAAEYQLAVAEPIRIAKNPLPIKSAPYFVDYVKTQLQNLYPPRVLQADGLNIYTTLQPDMQLAAQEAIKNGLAHLEEQYPRLKKNDPDKQLQAAMVVVQPATGAILAMVGGRNYAQSSYNRAIYAVRQPGSAIKPFEYLAALDKFTPVSWLPDEPITYDVAGQHWTPRNYDSNEYQPRVTVRHALEHSLNVPTVSLAMSTGLNKIIATLRRFGIKTPLEPVPSLALGAFGVTPLQLADAYATLDNGGQRPFLLSLKDVVSASGQVEQRRNVNLVSVTTPAKAFLITDLLEGVIKHGTGRNLKYQGIDFPCAGKTGTTNDWRDSWFAGYTTDLVAVVWVGFDNNQPTGLTGARGAATIWARFMNRVQPWINPQPFKVPPGIVQRYICDDSGELATSSCQDRHPQYFLADHVPTQYYSSESDDIVPR